MISISGGSTKIILTNHTWQSEARTADKLEILLGAVGGTEDKVTIEALTDPTKAQISPRTLGPVIAVAKAKVVAVADEKTSLERHRA